MPVELWEENAQGSVKGWKRLQKIGTKMRRSKSAFCLPRYDRRYKKIGEGSSEH
jgi:hypothetical protein